MVNVIICCLAARSRDRFFLRHGLPDEHIVRHTLSCLKDIGGVENIVVLTNDPGTADAILEQDQPILTIQDNFEEIKDFRRGPLWLAALRYLKSRPTYEGLFSAKGLLVLAPTRGRMLPARISAALQAASPGKVILLSRRITANANPFWVYLVSPLSLRSDIYLDRNTTKLPRITAETFFDRAKWQAWHQDNISGSHLLPDVRRIDESIAVIFGAPDLLAIAEDKRTWELVELSDDMGACGYLPYDLPVLDLALDSEISVATA